MHDFPMYYIPNVTKKFLICMFVMLYLDVLHGNKTYSLLTYSFIVTRPLVTAARAVIQYKDDIVDGRMIVLSYLEFLY